MAEALKFDEIFSVDKQDYEYTPIKIAKKRKKIEDKFNLGSMNIEGNQAPGKTEAGTPSQLPPAQSPGNEGDVGPPATPVVNNEPTGSPQKPSSPVKPPQESDPDKPHDRSIDVLSDDDDDPPAATNKPSQPYVDQNEKPMDVFKSMFSEFKEFIPDRFKNEKEKQEAEEKKAKEASQPKVSFMN